jgi:hypothetical protein
VAELAALLPEHAAYAAFRSVSIPIDFQCKIYLCQLTNGGQHADQTCSLGQGTTCDMEGVLPMCAE